MWSKYGRKGVAEMRHFIKGEDVSNISVSSADFVEVIYEGGGMVARNSKNHDDQWYVAKKYFQDNFIKVGDV